MNARHDLKGSEAVDKIFKLSEEVRQLRAEIETLKTQIILIRSLIDRNGA
jgi:hypothetical protein